VLIGCRVLLLWFFGWLVIAGALSLWLGSALYLLLLLVGLAPAVFAFRFKKRAPACPRCGTAMQARALGALVPGLVCPSCGHVEAHVKLKG
jgi:hypothetical protein